MPPYCFCLPVGLLFTTSRKHASGYPAVGDFAAGDEDEAGTGGGGGGRDKAA